MNGEKTMPTNKEDKIKRERVDNEGNTIVFVLDNDMTKYYSFLKGTCRLHSFNDKPAVVSKDGYKTWYKSGKLHRDNGPAMIWKDQDFFWYKNGKKHRDNGPAIDCKDGSKQWFINGKRHREDGPAFEYKDIAKEYWVNNAIMSEDEFNEWRKNNENRKNG
jgi:hypothetical protein